MASGTTGAPPPPPPPSGTTGAPPPTPPANPKLGMPKNFHLKSYLDNELNIDKRGSQAIGKLAGMGVHWAITKAIPSTVAGVASAIKNRQDIYRKVGFFNKRMQVAGRQIARSYNDDPTATRAQKLGSATARALALAKQLPAHIKRSINASLEYDPSKQNLTEF